MASDLEFVSFKDFVDGLPGKQIVESNDKIVFNDPSTGPVSLDGDNFLSTSFDLLFNSCLLEMGNAVYSSSSIVYQDSTTRARTKKGVWYKVNAGDVVGVKAGFQMYVCYTSDGEVPYTREGWITKKVFATDCYVQLLFRKGSGSDSSTTFEELSDSVYVRVFNSGLSQIKYFSQRIGFIDSLVGKSLKGLFVGEGNSYLVFNFNATKGAMLRITLDNSKWNDSSLTSGYKKFCVRKNVGGTITNFIEYAKGDYVPSVIEFVAPNDADSLDLFFRGNVGENVGFILEQVENSSLVISPRTALLKAVNHRGYNTIAPENTLPAFRLSAKMGFGIVETDIRETADGYLVCIHDASVDRTSNGSGNVADKTLAQLKALDFGSWKDAEYTGTTIPTFEEFLTCCRNLGLKAYVEIKANVWFKAIKIAKSLEMMDNITWIGSTSSYLGRIVSDTPTARIGYIINSYSSEELSKYAIIKSPYNEAFFDINNSNLTSSDLDELKQNNIPVEVWTIDSISTIYSLDPYIAGVTSNILNASSILYEKELNG